MARGFMIIQSEVFKAARIPLTTAFYTWNQLEKEPPATPNRRGFFGQAERALYHPCQSLFLPRDPNALGKRARLRAAAFSVLACAPGDRSAKLPPGPPHKGMKTIAQDAESKEPGGCAYLFMGLCKSIIHCFHLFVNFTVRVLWILFWLLQRIRICRKRSPETK